MSNSVLVKSIILSGSDCQTIVDDIAKPIINDMAPPASILWAVQGLLGIIGPLAGCKSFLLLTPRLGVM